MLQIGMSQGMNMAHSRLQDIVSKLKLHTMTRRNKIIYWISTTLKLQWYIPRCDFIADKRPRQDLT
jgi:hypothetical protein